MSECGDNCFFCLVDLLLDELYVGFVLWVFFVANELKEVVGGGGELFGFHVILLYKIILNFIIVWFEEMIIRTIGGR